MQKEIHLENKKILHILAVSGIIVILIAFFLEYECLFKRIINIPCMSCGLTRGFIYLLNFDIINATNSNLLSLPLFICITIYYFLYVIWFILKKEYIFKYYNYFVKNYKLVLLVLVINWVINIIKYL